MRKNRVIEQNRCYHLVSRLAHRAFFLDDEEKDRAVALMRRVEAGVKASMSYCINRTLSISSNPFDPFVDGPMRPSALRKAVGIRSPIHFSRYYLRPLMEKGMIERTDPDSPKSPRQEYKLA